MSKSKVSKVSSNEETLKEVIKSQEDIENILEKVSAVDNTCCFTKCKTRTKDIGIQCKYCGKRFCISHGLPEIHGCGEAVRRDEKRKFLHPTTKLSDEKHSQAHTKLNMKLKQMQMERKPQGSKKK